ncbi:MAG: hypothetical protein GF364_04815 [Candidatus Lokiarchaeota archaeon]|nr:hypothetical protein [Candidatus Lokiarchaeota archaeon]
MSDPYDSDTGNEADEWDDYSVQDIAQEKEIVAVGREAYSRMEVDLYKTKMHGAIIGVRQKDQYMSKSRQFTHNMEVKGEIKFFYGYDEENKKERDGYTEVVVLDEYWWDADKDSELYKRAESNYPEYDPDEYAKIMRRLILKTFIGLDEAHDENKGRWTGTIEESQIMSFCLSFGEKDPLPFFWINAPGFKYRIPLFRTHAVTGERYVFPLFDEDGVVTPYYIEAKRFTPGSDFQVYNAATWEKVAWVDDRSTNIGGKVDVQLFEENDDLNRNRVFRRVLLLFAAASKYFHPLYKNYSKIYKAMVKQKDYKKDLKKKEEKGEDLTELNEKYAKAMQKLKFLKKYEVSPTELSLHFNPRRVRT